MNPLMIVQGGKFFKTSPTFIAFVSIKEKEKAFECFIDAINTSLMKILFHYHPCLASCLDVKHKIKK